jgi:hypothetical protein
VTRAVDVWAERMAERLVTVRQIADLHVFRVAVGDVEVLSYPTRDRADQVAEALRSVIADAANCAAPAVAGAADPEGQ